jgi:hypothetical protein
MMPFKTMKIPVKAQQTVSARLSLHGFHEVHPLLDLKRLWSTPYIHRHNSQPVNPGEPK